MSRSFCWSLMAVAFLAFAGAADDSPGSAQAKPNGVIAYFHDGTRVRTIILQDSIEVVTKYGKLMVPAADIRRVEFGFRVSNEDDKRLQSALRDLKSNSFQDREAAAKELLALGRLAYPSLVALAKDTDLDTTKRVEEILKGIKAIVPAEQLRSRLHDLIYTKEFTIAGRISAPSLKATTEHFGDVTLKLVNLKSMHSTAGIGEVKLDVDAVTYGSNNLQWMDTGYMVNPDVKLKIAASGQVDLYGNQNPGQYISGPEGNRNVGRSGAYLSGMLLGRFGEDGPMFVVGRKYEGTPTTEGKLYLRIMALNGSGGATGKYTVRITTGQQ